MAELTRAHHSFNPFAAWRQLKNPSIATFGACSSREDYTSLLSSQYNVASVGKSNSDIVVGANIGFKIEEIIYDLKVIIVYRDVETA